MNQITELLTDVKHWIGWFLTSIIIYLIFYYLMVNFPNLDKILTFIILLLIVVIVDIFKHVTKLQ